MNTKYKSNRNGYPSGKYHGVWCPKYRRKVLGEDTEGNLTALRKLALRRTAEKTEAQLQQYLASHKINKL